ncbi:uncharacterized protein LOC110983015 [Acanthaster planci]|uniref:Uncharacterized protein LOC110983015 n=1 Tax=Acanthaster planci TaxID=133434 RepID=A0A8B7YXZ5_ACAPL|nr:uncharacterized protein LOC110983015 [Acanthaster planci]
MEFQKALNEGQRLLDSGQWTAKNMIDCLYFSMLDDIDNFADADVIIANSKIFNMLALRHYEKGQSVALFTPYRLWQRARCGRYWKWCGNHHQLQGRTTNLHVKMLSANAVEAAVTRSWFQTTKKICWRLTETLARMLPIPLELQCYMVHRHGFIDMECTARQPLSTMSTLTLKELDGKAVLKELLSSVKKPTERTT